MAQPRITGEWTSADPTANRIEHALTDATVKHEHGGHEDEEKVIARRDTFTPDRMIFTTPTQVKAAFSDLSTGSPAGQLIREAGQH